MNIFITLALLCGSLLLAGCENGVVERRTVIRRSYRDVDDDRIYYRDPHYYDARVVRRTGYAYYPPRYRTYSSNPLDAPASGSEARAVRRVTVIRR
jgi:hypothetical protein